MSIIKTRALTKKYNNFKALDNVSLNVKKGGIYGFIGKNGAGKTTFFKCLMGLTEKTSGEITIANDSNLNIARSKIGFMIGPSFFPYLSARQNIEYYRKLKGISNKDETSRVLKLVGLEGINKPFKSFSMGMKQRLGIANALLGSPEIVILDEPLNGLDPEGITDIRHIIKEINTQQGTTFIISSHILTELDLIATEFGFIDHGVLLKEISYNDLHLLTSKSLVLEVNDVDKAIEVLQSQLQIQEYTINTTGEIILDSYLSKPHKIAKAMINNDIELYQLRKSEMTLEEYFLQLIGGNQHA